MNEEKNKTEPGPEEAKNKKTAIVSVAATLIAVLIIAGAYWAWKKYSENKKSLETLKQQMEDLQKISGTAGDETPSTGGETTVAGGEASGGETGADYAGWKTYVNNEIGYQLKYPADWTLKEIDQFSELLDTTEKYVTITTPGKKLFLHWGLKQKTDAFAISDRTGMGVGDFKKDGKVTILGDEYDINRFIYKGKTKEVFYPNAGLTHTHDGKYDFVAALSYGSGSNYDALDIEDAAEKALAEKILNSVTLIGRSASAGGCAQNFTNEEKLDKADWKTYTNAKYGYSFKYPKDWNITTQEDKSVAMENVVDSIFFRWNSEEMTAFDYMGYHQTDKKNATIACQSAEETFLSGDAGTPNENNRLIFVDFKKSGKRHILTYSYRDFGASISSDLIGMFHLLVKTAAFN